MTVRTVEIFARAEREASALHGSKVLPLAQVRGELLHLWQTLFPHDTPELTSSRNFSTFIHEGLRAQGSSVGRAEFLNALSVITARPDFRRLTFDATKLWVS